MDYFVDKKSIVRQIWGKGDTILFIFSGASAEFALNKEVDWLYFTGKLPGDPVKRLFSTVAYARQIIFSEENAALKAIDQITAIHNAVEISRNAKISDWAYRDVLFMLIHYSIASFELMERKLTADEKEEVYNVFFRLGYRMGLKELPKKFTDWINIRNTHLQRDLEKSHFTLDLFKQYKKQLGFIRYKILLQSQILVVPKKVNDLLELGQISWFRPLLSVYKIMRKIKLDGLLKSLVLPAGYRKEIIALDVLP